MGDPAHGLQESASVWCRRNQSEQQALTYHCVLEHVEKIEQLIWQDGEDEGAKVGVEQSMRSERIACIVLRPRGYG